MDLATQGEEVIANNSSNMFSPEYHYIQQILRDFMQDTPEGSMRCFAVSAKPHQMMTTVDWEDRPEPSEPAEANINTQPPSIQGHQTEVLEPEPQSAAPLENPANDGVSMFHGHPYMAPTVEDVEESDRLRARKYAAVYSHQSACPEACFAGPSQQVGNPQYMPHYNRAWNIRTHPHQPTTPTATPPLQAMPETLEQCLPGEYKPSMLGSAHALRFEHPREPPWPPQTQRILHSPAGNRTSTPLPSKSPGQVRGTRAQVSLPGFGRVFDSEAPAISRWSSTTSSDKDEDGEHKSEEGNNLVMQSPAQPLDRQSQRKSLISRLRRIVPNTYRHSTSSSEITKSSKRHSSPDSSIVERDLEAAKVDCGVAY